MLHVAYYFALTAQCRGGTLGEDGRHLSRTTIALTTKYALCLKSSWYNWPLQNYCHSRGNSREYQHERECHRKSCPEKQKSQNHARADSSYRETHFFERRVLVYEGTVVGGLFKRESINTVRTSRRAYVG